MRTVSMAKLESELSLLDFSSLLQISRPGIALSQLSAFEKLLTPIPRGLVRVFPTASIYKGIALNVFTIRQSDNEFRLFPTSLSDHSRNNEFFQVDMVVDNDAVRNPEAREVPRPNVLHCLLVTQLSRLVNKFSDHRLNVSKYDEICRVCMTTFKRVAAKLAHFRTCTDKKRSICGKRRVRNQLIHRPYRLNPFTLKQEENGLSFDRGKCARLLKPLSFSCLDFEQLSRTVDKNKADATDFERTPSQAIKVQTPLSYSIQHRSLYPEIQLPEKLASPRVKFINEDEEQPEKSFFLSLMYTIREDLLLHSRFIEDLLSYNHPPPPMSQRTAEQISYMQSVDRCQICNVRFGSRKTSPKTKAFYIVKRCFDHFHFLQDSSKIRAVICQVRRSFSMVGQFWSVMHFCDVNNVGPAVVYFAVHPSLAFFFTR